MADVFFNDSPEVLARLTYDPRTGHPMAICAGKVRDRERDRELLVAWLRALRDQINPEGGQ